MSDRAARRAMIILAALGWGIAAYLTYVHYRGLHSLCLTSGGCEIVQGSKYAKLAGIPVALLGLIGYTAILATLWVRGETGRLAGVATTFVGFGFSAYLTYREIFTIEAICQWCVASAVILTLLLGLAVHRFLRAEDVSGGAHP